MRRLAGSAALLTVASLLPFAAAPALAAPIPGTSAATVVSAKSSGGSLRVVTEGVPQGRTAKITVAGKEYRKKIPTVGKLRNLRPGTYRVWATPIVTDGGTSAVADLPVRVKVRSKKPAVLRLRYTWNPRSDIYPPGPASGLEVTSTATDAIALKWRNGQAPDIAQVAIRRKPGTQAPQSLDEGRLVPVQGIGTEVTDSEVRSHTRYSYSVFMVDTAGNASRPASITVRTLGEAAAVTAGNSHTCDLLIDQGVVPVVDEDAGSGDRVECWGANTFGQLGNGTREDSDEPVLIDLDDVVKVAAGGDHTCALQGDGQVWCWGRNDFGQLGQGDRQDSAVPVLVNLPEIADIAVGGEHTCAVLTSGTVRCFGRNDHGQLGVNRSAFEDEPVAVPLLVSAQSAAAGYAHTCVVLDNDSVRCWGRNDSGQLGNNSRADSSTAVRPLLGPVNTLTAGVFHTCALLVDASLSCWGSNAYGQVGDPGAADRLTPTAVAIGSVAALDAGAYHTCAVLTGGTARCWGRNSGGRLGDGTENDHNSPTRVAGLSAATAIAAGAYHTCAVTGAKITCWGSNESGQLGTGDRSASLRPAPVVGF